MTNNRKPKHRLKNLSVNEVSLVDRGDNPAAHVVMFKRVEDDQILDKSSEQGAETVDIEELKKQLADKEAELQKSKEEKAALAEQLEKAAKAPKKDDEMTEDKKDKEETEKSFQKALNEQKEAFEKQLADVAKQAAESAEIAKKERELRIDMEYAQKAEEMFPNTPGTPEEKGAMLKSIDAMPEEIREFTLKSMKASDEAMKKNFESSGSLSAAPAEGSALQKLEKLAMDKAGTTDKNDSKYFKAYADVIATDEGKALYAKSRQE